MASQDLIAGEVLEFNLVLVIKEFILIPCHKRGGIWETIPQLKQPTDHRLGSEWMAGSFQGPFQQLFMVDLNPLFVPADSNFMKTRGLDGVPSQQATVRSQ